MEASINYCSKAEIRVELFTPIHYVKANLTSRNKIGRQEIIPVQNEIFNLVQAGDLDNILKSNPSLIRSSNNVRANCSFYNLKYDFDDFKPKKIIFISGSGKTRLAHLIAKNSFC